MKKVIFFPICESHDENFSALINRNESDEDPFNCQYLYIEEANTREYKPNVDDNLLFYLPKEEGRKHKNKLLKNLFSESPGGLLVVGNDSCFEVRNVIRLARKSAYRIVLLQDGWLRSQSLNKPIKSQMSVSKYYIKRLLANKYSPIERFFHGFIAHFADYHFVFSELAKQEFISAGIEENKIYITGSPRHQKIKQYRKTSKEENNFLYLLPSFFSADKQNYTDLKNNYLGTVNCIKRLFNGNFDIYIKPHPREKIDFFENLEDTKVHLCSDSIPTLIQKYNFRCAFSMINSTAVIEMIVAGIPIIQYTTKSRGKATGSYPEKLPVIESEEEICEMIQKYDIAQDDFISVIADYADKFDSIRRVNELLKDLLYESK